MTGLLYPNYFTTTCQALANDMTKTLHFNYNYKYNYNTKTGQYMERKTPIK